jgi:ABC-type sugar transport system ATPase subunit
MFGDKSNKPLLQLKNISKKFPGVIALNDVNLQVRQGEILGLMGENGAGKSTLIKILSGGLEPTQGQIFLEGKTVSLKTPSDSHQMGIASVYQDVYLIPNLTVAENIFIGHKTFTQEKSLIIKKSQLVQKAQTELIKLGFPEIKASEVVKRLSAAQRQIVAIVKALVFNAKILLLDEPTSSLSEGEVERFFILLKDLKQKGVAIIFISHHIEEVFRIVDSIAVMRNGELVGYGLASEYDFERVKKDMVGEEKNKSLSNIFQRHERSNTGNSILSVHGLTKNKLFKNISFNLYEGEVLGFAGLVGSGRTELAKALFGALSYDSGEITFLGEKVRFKSCRDAINNGIYYLTENRFDEGIFPVMSVADNILISNPEVAMNNFLIKTSLREEVAKEYIEKLSIKAKDAWMKISQLSGGNQQKCLFARLLNCKGKILLLDEPTRGVDISAKEEIHGIIDQFLTSRQQRAVIMISSDLPEVIAKSDRVVVMREGRIVTILEKNELTRETVLSYMLQEKVS